MRGDERRYSTSRPFGYIGALVLLGLGYALAVKGAEAGSSADRILSLAVFGLVFIPAAVYTAIDTGRRGFVMTDDSLCIRQGIFAKRCIRLSRLIRVEWIYRSDRRAGIELQWLSETDHLRGEIVSYAGRWRHETMERLMSDLMTYADLRPGSGEGLQMERPGRGRLALERATPIATEPRTDQQQFHGAPGARDAVIGCLVFVVLFGAVTVGITVRDLRSEKPFSIGEHILLALFLIGVPLGFVVYNMLQERNCRTELRHDGIVVTNTFGEERRIPWDRIRGMLWQHSAGKHQRGHLDLEVTSELGHLTRQRIARYLGPLPGEVISLRGAIIRRLDLVQVEATQPGFWRSNERVRWARPGGWDDGG